MALFGINLKKKDIPYMSGKDIARKIRSAKITGRGYTYGGGAIKVVPKPRKRNWGVLTTIMESPTGQKLDAARVVLLSGGAVAEQVQRVYYPEYYEKRHKPWWKRLLNKEWVGWRDVPEEESTESRAARRFQEAL